MGAYHRNPAEKREWIDAAVASNTDECIDWPWGTVGPMKYGHVRIGKKSYRVHNIVCEKVHGPRPPKMDAAHSCNRAICCNPRHLRWDTRAGNLADKAAAGTHNRGESHNMAKLTESKVRDIRTHWRLHGFTQTDLAEMYGVTLGAIHLIVHDKTWRSVA